MDPDPGGPKTYGSGSLKSGYTCMKLKIKVTRLITAYIIRSFIKSI
jgi:hypothetical protein